VVLVAAADVVVVVVDIVVSTDVLSASVVVDDRVDVARVERLAVLDVDGGLGHVGSRSTTLTGPPKRSHAALSSSPRSNAADTCSGVMLNPMT
jgi:hypothetical protein